MVSEDERGYLSVDNSAMTYMLVNAVKEQQEMIQQQQDVVLEQQNMIEALLERVSVLESQGRHTQVSVSAEVTTQMANNKK
jgi:hypothetical protein